LHPASGGDGSLLCSGDTLLQALVACAGVTLRAVATSIGVEVRSGSISAEGDLDFRGTLGVDRETPVGFVAIRLRFDLETNADARQLVTLQKLTERYDHDFVNEWNTVLRTSFVSEYQNNGDADRKLEKGQRNGLVTDKGVDRTNCPGLAIPVASDLHDCVLSPLLRRARPGGQLLPALCRAAAPELAADHARTR